jgi:hypothetical protein
MAVQSLTWENEPIVIAEITEIGLNRSWFLAADARIKTANNTIGIGPVAYKGPLKNSENVASKDGYSRDMVVMFYTDTDCKRAELMNQEPGDINDTVNDFLASHGGDTTAMLALAPTVA